MAETSSPTNSGNQNMMGAVAYLLGFVTGIILLLVEKENKFVRFHAMQSTMVFGGLFVVGMVLGYVPVVGLMLSFLIGPVELILWVILMWKAFSGETFKLPYVGEMAEKQLAKMS